MTLRHQGNLFVSKVNTDEVTTYARLIFDVSYPYVYMLALWSYGRNRKSHTFIDYMVHPCRRDPHKNIMPKWYADKLWYWWYILIYCVISFSSSGRGWRRTRTAPCRNSAPSWRRWDLNISFQKYWHWLWQIYFIFKEPSIKP